MPKFRKKPIVIEAFKWTASVVHDPEQWPVWIKAAWQKPMEDVGSIFPLSGALVIHTLEGNHVISLDDYIIQGIKGEIYPCKPDIFEATYEVAE